MYANFRSQIKIRILPDLTEHTADGWGTYIDAQGRLVRQYFQVTHKQFLEKPNNAGFFSIKLQFLKQGINTESIVIKSQGAWVVRDAKTISRLSHARGQGGPVPVAA